MSSFYPSTLNSHHLQDSDADVSFGVADTSYGAEHFSVRSVALRDSHPILAGEHSADFTASEASIPPATRVRARIMPNAGPNAATRLFVEPAHDSVVPPSPSLLAAPSPSPSPSISAADEGCGPPSPTRWYVLALFCLISCNQSLIWITFSPVSRSTEAYYSVDEGQVDLLLNWGPIVYLPAVVFTAWAARTNRGLRMLVVAAAWICFLSCLLRLVPELPRVWGEAPSTDQGGNLVYASHSWLRHDLAIWFLHGAQILNALMGPLTMAPVSKLSCVWFAPDERTLATSVLLGGASAGSMLGFLLAPTIVTAPELMPRYLVVQALLSGVAWVSTIVYFPRQPRLYPSVAARNMALHPGRALWPDVKSAQSNKGLIFLALSTGWFNGVFNILMGVLSTILLSSSEQACGWMSLGSTAAGAASGVIVGNLAMRSNLKRKLKMMCVMSSIGTTLCVLWFAASVPSVVSSSALLPSTPATIALSIVLMGLLLGAGAPLSYELAAELTYPLPEGISGGLLSGVNNLSGGVFLFVSPHVSGAFMCAFTLVTGVLTTALLMAVPEHYRRMDEESAHAGEDPDAVLRETPLLRHAGPASDEATLDHKFVQQYEPVFGNVR